MAEGRSSNTPILLVIAGAVIVAGIAGYFLSRDSGAKMPPAQTAPTVVVSPGSPGSPSGQGGTAERPDPATPDRTASGSAAPGRWSEDGASDYREYVVNGVRVRDHRGNNKNKEVFTPSVAGSGGAAISPPPARDLPAGRAFPPALTTTLGRQVRSVVAACAAQIPGDQRGAKPRALATITVGVKSKVVTVEKTVVVLADVVAGEPVDAARTCIETKSVGINAPTEEADVTDYDISLSYPL